MNSLFSILIKNLVLLTLIVISLVFVFTTNIGYKEIQYIFLSMGTLYVLAACFEAYKLSQTKPGTKRFIYFPDGFAAKRFLKVIAFTACGVVLYVSHSIIMYLSFLCFLIGFTEIVVTAWRYFKHLCFIAFEDDRLLLATNKIHTIRAKEIAKIEARHGLTYFVNHNKNSITVRTDMMDEKEAFKLALEEWITKNDLQDKVALL
jgi:hypothetical protein